MSQWTHVAGFLRIDYLQFEETESLFTSSKTIQSQIQAIKKKLTTIQQKYPHLKKHLYQIDHYHSIPDPGKYRLSLI